MSLEAGSFVSDLNQSNPPGTDKKKQGDDHLRLIKAVLRGTFPNGDRAQYFPRGLASSSNQSPAATDMEKNYIIDATGGARTVTLPTLVAGNDGWAVRVAKSDSSANTVTIIGTINGGTNFVLTRQWEGAFVLWTGAAWVALRHISSVGTNDIETNAITNAKVADDAINTAEVVNLAITSGKLSDNSVTTAKILDAQVTNAKLVGARRTTQYLTTVAAGQTYTTPANCKSIIVHIKGAGGGGARSQGGPFAGSDGGDTTFNGVVAKGGKGAASGVGGAGGSGGSGSATYRMPGSAGGHGGNNGGGFDFAASGGPGMWGCGAGLGGDNVGGTPTAGAANSGAGGGGDDGGGGGGAGEHAILEIQSPAASYVFTITAGGAAGSSAAAGGSGVIIVEEYY
jgi:hypothetical protein